MLSRSNPADRVSNTDKLSYNSSNIYSKALTLLRRILTAPFWVEEEKEGI